MSLLWFSIVTIALITKNYPYQVTILLLVGIVIIALEDSFNN